MRHFESWIDAWMEYTENTEPSPLYRKWCAISAVASALQRKCYTVVGEETDEIVSALKHYPNLYIVLVGPSASGKGTAMAPVLDLLQESELNITIAPNAVTRAALVGAMNRASTFYQNDEGIPTFHASLTVHSQEFSVFMGNKNTELINDLIDFYDCLDKWDKETKHVGTDNISGVWLNILGATTPQALQDMLPSAAIGGGFTSRIVFVFANGRSKRIPFPSYPRGMREKLLADLAEIAQLRGIFRLSSEVLERYRTWYVFEDEPTIKDERFAHYFGRRPTLTMKVATIISAARSSECIITLSDFESALGVMDEVERPMQFALSGIGKSPLAGITAKIIAEISHVGNTTMSELITKFYNDVTMTELDSIITMLQRMGFCTVYLNTGAIVHNRDFKHGESMHG